MTNSLEGNRAGVTDTECENTIELELSAEQMSMLARADTSIQSNQLPVQSVEKSLPSAPKVTRGVNVAVVLGIAAATVLSGGIAFLAKTRGQPVPVRANRVTRSPVAENPNPPSADNAPVLFTNPFDSTEVFELPPGTSKSEARHAVADLLLQRARDRRNSFQSSPTNTEKQRTKARLLRP